MKPLFTFAILISIYTMSACTQENDQENMTVGELNTLAVSEDENKVILDVRTPQEFAEGKIAGSKNLDVLKTDLFTTSIQKLDKDKTYYVICRSGTRSQQAVEKMKKAGFRNVINVKGGMVAWEEANLPVEK